MNDTQFLILFSMQIEVNKKFNFTIKQQAYFNMFLRELNFDHREDILTALLRQ